LTCSDRASRGERADVSGPTIHNLVIDRLGGQVAQYKVVPDDRLAIESTLIEWADRERLDLIFTTGGTGFSPRDVTPEATRAVVERETPALVQAMLFESLRVTPYAMLTRATAGIRRRTLIINLPGNPKAVSENFDAIAEVLPHAVDIVRGVDTHAGREGHAGHRAAHAAHGDRHDHQAPAGPHRHEDAAATARAGETMPATAGRHGHTEHSAHGEQANTGAPKKPLGGIARNVGGPPC
jgi:molybdenum cofactor synthesis domain-containing protein